MAERLHPGVYMEERRGGLAPIQGVSTSNYGTCGFTERGPSDEAVLSTSFTQFDDTFGGFTSKSQVPTHVFAFFANGGRRAYTVRVTGSGSVAASGFMESDWADETIATGDGSTVAMDSAAPTIGEVDISHAPQIVAGEISVTFKQVTAAVAVLGDLIGGAAPAMTLFVTTGTPFHSGMVGQSLTLVGTTSPGNVGTFPITAVSTDGKTLSYTNAAGVAEALVGSWAVGVVAEASDLSPVPAGVGTNFVGKLGAAVGSPDQAIVPGSVNIQVIAAAESYTDPNADGVLEEAGAPGVPKGYVDYDTGHFSVSFDTAPVNPADVTYDYVPQPPDTTVTDDGVGGWNAPATAGAVDYATGVWSMTVPYAPALGLPVLVAYTQQVWQYDAISEGVWGDDVRVDIRGDENYWTRATASYSRYEGLVYRKDSDGVYQLEETLDNLSLTDPTDARYIATVFNTEGIGSSNVELVEPSNEDVAPRSLNGYQKTRGVGAGEGTQTEFGSSGATPTIPAPFVTDPLETPIQPGSVSFAWTDINGVARTATDDGDGNITGDVDPTAAAGYNAIDYDTGEFAIKTGDGSAAVAVGDFDQAGAGTIVTVSFYLEPSETAQQDALSGGNDGAALTRSEITDPSLKADREGMYALLTTNELMNVGIPDAAGDVTMSLDQTTEAETNGEWFIILATPPGYSPQQAKDYRLNKLGYTGSYAALYYPYITIADPVTDLPVNIPPCGHIAGVYARTDNNKNVSKAPAGVEDGRLNFSTGLERNLEFAEIDILHPNQINALIDTPQTGRCVWGARSLERPPSDFRYLQVRRLFNFLKKSIFNSTHGFVFESVGAALRNRIRLSIESFLLVLFNQGYFAGTTPAEAFLVVCDETNNPPEVEDTGTVICDIYVAPNKPGEFIVFRLQQKTNSAE